MTEHFSLRVFATDACGTLPLEFKEWTAIRGITAMKFVAAKKALWTNYTGWCVRMTSLIYTIAKGSSPYRCPGLLLTTHAQQGLEQLRPPIRN